MDTSFEMTELQELYRQGFPVAIEALNNALLFVSVDGPQAMASLRRIAALYRNSSKVYGYDTITDISGKLETCPREEIEVNARGLIEAMQTILAENEQSTQRILIVEDEPMTAALMKSTLQTENREIVVAVSVGGAQALMSDSQFDLVILDLVLPDGDGRRLLLEMRERFETSSVPIVISSSKTGAAVKSECFALGANEYIEKPIDTAEFSTIINAVFTRSAVTRFSHLDSLTGLPNRASFREGFSRAIAQYQRTGNPVCVAILDFDYFKEINDRHGHNTGDRVLRQAAGVLKSSMRKSDLIARWGGEEFVILMTDTLESGAVAAIEKTLEDLRNTSFSAMDGSTFSLTFSAGVAQVEEGEPLQEAMARADLHLLEAKSAGRATISNTSRSSNRESRKILIAEDDPMTATLIQHRLSKEGFEITVVENGQEAINILTEDYSLVILDYKMPLVDGFQVLKHIRSVPTMKTLPVILLTSIGKEKEIERGFELGADDYMTKPFSPTELAIRVLHHFRRRL